MNHSLLPDNPYLLLTPGPLSTTKTVKAAMLRDWCTWDQDYKELVQDLRTRLVSLATSSSGYTAVPLQGSGTYCVESVIGSVIPDQGKLLVLANGAYGQRIGQIAARLGIRLLVDDYGELGRPDPVRLNNHLTNDPAISHVAVVHCETTTGMLNPIEELGPIVRNHGRVFILDAMSSFGGIPFDCAELGIDFLVSSANKCLQGIPGFGFVIAARDKLEECRGRARSLSLDLYSQYRTMEEEAGKWRYTSPTHVVRALYQALMELEEEGGVPARLQRYEENHRRLVEGMRSLGFKTLLPDELQSPIITSFVEPNRTGYNFRQFYEALKAKGYVIYPGKVTEMDTFRIGHIGHIFPRDIENLLEAVRVSIYWSGKTRSRAA